MTDNKSESKQTPAPSQPDESKAGQKQQNQNQGDRKPDGDKPGQQQK